MLPVFPRDVLDEILDLIESVSEGFPTYFCTHHKVKKQNKNKKNKTEYIQNSFLYTKSFYFEQCFYECSLRHNNNTGNNNNNLENEENNTEACEAGYTLFAVHLYR